ncbi:hypothetical protein CLI84_08550 [Porphyromonas gingivalis]|nr:hypothetical protein CLI84_08550 [Porphyromonas gingivalis]
MNLYKYIYYRLYTWNLKKWGKIDGPEWNALFGISIMMFLNLMTLSLLLDVLGLINYWKIIHIREIVIAVSLSILVVNYFCFIRRKQYFKIIKRYKQETTIERHRNTIIIWFYFFASVLSPFLIININKI